MQPEIREFLSDEAAKDLSKSTLDKRRSVMGWLDRWAEKPVTEFEPSDIKGFVVHLKNGEYLEATSEPSHGTVLGYLSHVTKLFEWLENEGHIEENPRESVEWGDYLTYESTEMKRSLRQSKNYIALSQSEAEALVEHAPNPKLRNTLLLKLLLTTGPRRSEITEVKLADVELDRRHITYITRKKDDEDPRTVKYPRSVQTLLKQWIDEGYRDRFTPSKDSPYLFVSRKSPKLSPDRVNRIVKEAAEYAGIQRPGFTDRAGNTQHKVRAHVLRHTFAELSIDGGMNISYLSDIMGHDSIETTKMYLDHDQRALDEAMDVHGPSI